MMETFIPLVNQHGYLALFCFLFLMEVGVPSPIPNELVLIISGYLIRSGSLSFIGVLTIIILSDVLAATVLYGLFYFFGSWLVNSKPKWIPIPTRSIMKLNQRINEQGISVVFVGRLTPFIRGYVAVISGLTHVKFRRYLLVVFTTTAIWGVFYLSIGYIITPYWQFVVPFFSKSIYVLIAIFLLIILIWLSRKIQFNTIHKS